MSSFINVGSAKAYVICDSLYAGSRLTTMEVVFPRPYLAVFNTHGRLTRNSARSSAIPTWRRMLDVLENPYIPNSFGINKAGMQAGRELSDVNKKMAVQNWLVGRDIAVAQAYSLVGGRKSITATVKGGENLRLANSVCDLAEGLIERYNLQNSFLIQDESLHKQHASRVLEPYLFHTVLVTASHFRNFFALRASIHAQPEMCDLALAMAKAMNHSIPKKLLASEWHLPYITEEDLKTGLAELSLVKASAGRCARTSYLTLDGRRSLDEDIKLAERLLKNGHMSPFQHQARPRHRNEVLLNPSGNYFSV